MRVQHPSLHNRSSLTPNRTSYPSTNQRLSLFFYTIIATLLSNPFQFQFFSFYPTLFCPSPSHSYTLSITNTLLINHSLLQPFNASHSQLLAIAHHSLSSLPEFHPNSTPTRNQPVRYDSSRVSRSAHSTGIALAITAAFSIHFHPLSNPA